MKFVSWLVCFCFTLNVFASTGDLEAVIDEFQYFATVEWDQKDRSKLEAKKKEFGEKIGYLITRDQIGKEDFLQLMEQKLHNAEAVKRLRVRLALTPGKLNQQELISIIREMNKDMYAGGASWYGRYEQEMLLMLGGLLLVIALGYWLGSSYEDDSATSEDSTYCQRYPDSSLCKDGEWRDFSKYVCTSYKDEWKCTTTERTDYWGTVTSDTTCGWYSTCATGYWND